MQPSDSRGSRFFSVKLALKWGRGIILIKCPPVTLQKFLEVLLKVKNT
jgi:hypothetical protein